MGTTSLHFYLYDLQRHAGNPHGAIYLCLLWSWDAAMTKMNHFCVLRRKMRADRNVRLKKRTNGSPAMMNAGVYQALLNILQKMIGKNRDKKMPL